MKKYVVTVQKHADPEGVAKGHGVKAGRVFKKAMNGFAAELSEAQANALRKNPHVLRVEEDLGAETCLLPWGLDRIDQRNLPLDGVYGTLANGAGVPVYIVDTGVRYSHAEFGGRAVFGFDAYGSDGSDCHGHGTHVAGTVGGATYGVARACKLVSVRVLDCNGSAQWSDVIAGLEWIAAQPRGVVNMSLGGGRIEAVNDAVQVLTDLGHVSCVAAGNSRDDATFYSPASAPSALTVGSTGPQDIRSWFSNWGTALDLFAPGEAVESACYTGDTDSCVSSGTSMATPHVAGVCALYLQANPSASAAEVMDAVKTRATQGIVGDSWSQTRDLLYARLDSEQPPDTLPPNLPPVADFVWSIDDPVVDPAVVTFTSTSTDPDGFVVAYLWHFGDENNSYARERSIRMRYLSPGTYSVNLLVTDDQGGQASVTKPVTVSFEPAPEPPPDPEPDPDPEPPPPSEITLGATVTKVRGVNTVQLAWSGARTATVDIYRAGVLLATVLNSGAYTDNLGTKGKVPSYRVCEPGGACSPEWSR